VAEKPTIPVFKGANVWRLLRTDRDAASSESIPQRTAAACWRFLESDLVNSPIYELVPTARNEWRFGAARPLRVLAVSDRPMEPSSDGPPARLVVDRQRLTQAAAVTGGKPWYVLVQFFWRLPDATLIYPAMVDGMFGAKFQLMGADWLLDKAWQVKVPKRDDPGDETWTEAMGDRAGQAMASASSALAQTMGGVLGVQALALLGLLWYLSKK